MLDKIIFFNKFTNVRQNNLFLVQFIVLFSFKKDALLKILFSLFFDNYLI